DRVLLDDIFKDVPDFGPLLLDELLRGLDRGRDPPLLELAEDEGLEQLERHLLGKTTLMKFQIGADNDHRPTGIIDPLPKEVLAEAPLFTLQRVRQRLERAVVRTRDHAPTTTVVEQRVHGLLEHPLLVPDDGLRRLEVHVAQQLADRLGAHAELERVGAVLLMKLARLVDREQVLLLGAGEPRVEDDVFLEVEDLLQLAQGHVQELSDATREPLEEPD